MKDRRVVIVEWGDAFIDTDDFDPEEAQDTEPCWRKTVGFLIAKNQHGYVLATDTYNDDPEVNSKMFIPHGMVRTVTQLFTRVKKD
jgi:hypothetical protein